MACQKKVVQGFKMTTFGPIAPILWSFSKESHTVKQNQIFHWKLFLHSSGGGNYWKLDG